jgi:hypothetical protein
MNEPIYMHICYASDMHPYISSAPYGSKMNELKNEGK